MKVFYGNSEKIASEIAKFSYNNPNITFGFTFNNYEYIFTPDEDGCRINITTNGLNIRGSTVVPYHKVRPASDIILNTKKVKAIIVTQGKQLNNLSDDPEDISETNIKISLDKEYNSLTVASEIMENTTVPVWVKCPKNMFNTITVYYTELFVIVLSLEDQTGGTTLAEAIADLENIIEWDRETTVKILYNLFKKQ